MNAREKAADKARRIQQAMFPLVGNPHFTHFIEYIRNQRDSAMIEAASDRVISDKRLLTTYLGQVRAFTEIIDMYESFLQRVEEVSETREEVS